MEIKDLLIEWYKENHRQLPWREMSDPYLIWISETILQQTRVTQGLAYYIRFVERFPNVSKLAEAEEDEVLKYWQGLGYYSRARNLHAAAKDVMLRFAGKMPTEYQDLLSLKGVGTYTAAAVASIAFKKPCAVVDGNVYRVLARLFGIEIPIDSGEGKKYFSKLANELICHDNPDLYNQAIMEFGALQCTPQNPLCMYCVLREKCVAFQKGLVNKLPVKASKTVLKERFFNYFFIQCKDEILIGKRDKKDIWQNLYEFPLIETEKAVDLAELSKMPEFIELFGKSDSINVTEITSVPRHILSHRIIYTVFYKVEVEEFTAGMEKYLKIPLADLDKYAVSRLISLYLEKL
ncbi:MAG: A/G-specific adenine glycosylase [Odoribacter sp.]|nr:A/G-specific adenine glycosylase [Odoribacter sp.]